MIEQKIVDPDFLFFEALRTSEYITGSEAVRDPVVKPNSRTGHRKPSHWRRS